MSESEEVTRVWFYPVERSQSALRKEPLARNRQAETSRVEAGGIHCIIDWTKFTHEPLHMRHRKTLFSARTRNMPHVIGPPSPNQLKRRLILDRQLCMYTHFPHLHFLQYAWSRSCFKQSKAPWWAGYLVWPTAWLQGEAAMRDPAHHAYSRPCFAKSASVGKQTDIILLDFKGLWEGKSQQTSVETVSILQSRTCVGLGPSFPWE